MKSKSEPARFRLQTKSHRSWESRPLSFREGVVFEKSFRSRGYYRSSARIRTISRISVITTEKAFSLERNDATVLKGIPANIPRTRMPDNVLPQERACYNGNTFRRGAWYTTRWRGEVDASILRPDNIQIFRATFLSRLVAGRTNRRHARHPWKCVPKRCYRALS